MLKKTLFYIVFFAISAISAAETNPPNEFFKRLNRENDSIKEKVLQDLGLKSSENYFHIDSPESEFTPAFLMKNYAVDTVTNEAKEKAKAVFAQLEETNNYIDSLTAQDLVTLPVGIKKEIGNVTVIMGISSAKFSSQSTEFTAFIKMTVQQTDTLGNQKQLFFGANNIKLSHQGGIYGDTNLVLLGDIPIKLHGGSTLLVLNGGFDMNTGDVEQKTYVTIDCNGFKELALDADVIFSRTKLQPVDAHYNLITADTARVRGHFNTTVRDWSDILVEVSLPPFQLTKEGSTDGKGKGGLVFELNTAIFDFSDFRNSTNMHFPDGYDQYLIEGNHEAWRGVYVNSLSVVLPEQFKKKSNTSSTSSASATSSSGTSSTTATSSSSSTTSSTTSSGATSTATTASTPSQRVKFQASKLLIDGVGVSGTFSVDNVLPIHEGSASKWQFSVDHFGVTIMANQLTGADFNGKIVLPLTKEVKITDDSTAIRKKSLFYTALINPVDEEYTLTVQTNDSLAFNIFKAKATITPNSYIELKVREGNFKPKAVLHGTLSIDGDREETTGTATAASGTGTSTTASATPSTPETQPLTQDTTKESTSAKGIKFKGITFQSLELQTEAPYFKVEYMGYSGDSIRLAKFPVTLSDISIKATDTQAYIKFDLAVNLMNSDQQGFSGGTTLKIIGKFSEAEGIQKWKYEKTSIKTIHIEANLGKVEMKGYLDLKREDPVYGNGFYGRLEAKFDKIDVKASAMFGKTDFRYWYVDAYADLSALEIKLTPTLNVKGFGGGAYHHMTTAPSKPMVVYHGKPVTTPMSPSGKAYKPDINAGLGFRAILGFVNAVKEKGLNGKVGFEMAFNTSGGINRILFFGEAHMLKSVSGGFGTGFRNQIKSLEESIDGLAGNSTVEALKDSDLVEYGKQTYPPQNMTFDAGIDANFGMEFDFQNSSFHADLEIFINTEGGNFKGIGANGRAGWAVFHIDPNSWYLHAGTPTNRIGVKVGMPPFTFEVGAYLMMGDNIPDSPPPPATVASILGLELESLDSMRDLNMLGDGRGFAIGMDIAMNTGDMTFLIFYAQFNVGLGFDIMLKDYGETACAGSGQIGANGWYANGQAYAYLEGKLGIKVKIGPIRKKIPIIELGAAVLLQAKLPNPSWFRGYLGGYYNLLGGAIKGRFRFKLELGEECEIVGGAPLGGIKIISDLKPNDNAGEVDVFAVPQAAFNVRINVPFDMEDDNGTHSYRILLDEFSIKNNGTDIVGELTWNENNDLASFTSTEVLPPDETIDFTVKVSFQELQNGAWVTLLNDGTVAQEIETVSFQTGEAPDYIPLNNIVYCYPIIDQEYFYKGERNTGYFKLDRGQGYLFNPTTDWTQEVDFETATASQTITAVSYNASNQMVNFNLPSFTNEETYTLRMISKAPNQGDTTTETQEDTYTSQETGQEGNTVEIKNKQAQAVVRDGVSSELITYDFATSSYNKFADKLNAKHLTQAILDPIYADVHALQADVQSSERFSLTELVGNNYTNYSALIATEAVLDDNYFTNTINPLIYQGYPLEPEFTVNRDSNILGIPPKKGMDILSWYLSYVENNPNYSLLNIRMPYRYYLPYHYKTDFIAIQYKIVNKYLGDPTMYQSQIQQYDYIINGVFPALQTGDYKVKYQYVLPGNILGSSAIFTYTNPY